MKLKNLDKHPYHTDIMTHAGYPLYDYQKEIIDKLDCDYLNYLENNKVDVQRYTVDGAINGNVKRMVTLGTGGGKSFISPYIMKSFGQRYSENRKHLPSAKRKESISVITSALKEVLVEHKKDVLKFTDSDQGKDFEVLVDKCPEGSLTNVKTIDEYIDGKLNVEGKHLILIFTHKWLENNIERLEKLNIDFVIIDEARALNYANDEEARKEGDTVFNKEGIRTKNQTWWKNAERLSNYIVILNATPSTAHAENEYGHYKLIETAHSDMSWRQPWLDITNTNTSNKSKIQKEEKIVKDMYDHLVQQLQHLHLVDCIEERYPIIKGLIHRHLHALIKCSSSKSSKTGGITVDEVEKLLIELNKKLLGTMIRIYDYFKGEYISVKYDNSLINPMIKDNRNKTSIDNINDPSYKDNVLLVCELGSFGINIGYLSLLIYLRDSNRHKGKEYTITQLLGRLARNGLIDNIFLCDLIVTINPSIDDYKFIKQAFMNLTRKKVSLFDNVTINDKALDKFKERLPNEADMSHTIDDILLNRFKWTPHDKTSMSSDGQGTERFYIDERDKECRVCDNVYFDIHFKKLIELGHSHMEATYFTIKDIMDNGHRHTKDDDTQRSICKSCHAIETRENKHYLASDNPERKEVA